MTVKRMHLWVASCEGDGRQWDAVVPAGDVEQAADAAREQAAWAFGHQTETQFDAAQIRVAEPVEVDDDQAQVYELSYRYRAATADEVLEHEQARRRLIDQIDPVDLVDVGLDVNQEFGIPDPIYEWDHETEAIWARTETEATRLATAGLGSDNERWDDLAVEHVTPLKAYSVVRELLDREAQGEAPDLPEAQTRLLAAIELAEHAQARIHALPFHQIERLQAIDGQLDELAIAEAQRAETGPAYFREAVQELREEKRRGLGEARQAAVEEVVQASGLPLEETVRLWDGFQAEHEYEIDRVDEMTQSLSWGAVNDPPQWILDRIGEKPSAGADAEQWTSAVKATVQAQLQIDPSAPIAQDLSDNPTAEQQPHLDRALMALETVVQPPALDLGR